jgi:hypothetical protein
MGEEERISSLDPEEGSLEGVGKYSSNGRLFGRAKEEKPHSD